MGAVKLEPSGQSFAKPVIIKVPIPSGLIRPHFPTQILIYETAEFTGYDPEEKRKGESESAPGHWESALSSDQTPIVGVVGAAGHTVSFATDHFSTYAIPSWSSMFKPWPVEPGVVIWVPSLFFMESIYGSMGATVVLSTESTRQAGYKEVLLELVLRTNKERSKVETGLADRIKEGIEHFKTSLAGASVDFAKFSGYVLKMVAVIDAMEGKGKLSSFGEDMGSMGGVLTNFASNVSLTQEIIHCLVDSAVTTVLYASLDYARAIERWEAIKPILSSSRLADEDPVFNAALADVETKSTNCTTM